MLTNIIIGVQIFLCLLLVIVVLMQEGNQKDLSGSIGGGAETFFGKNNSRTLNAKLKKLTAIVAILFLASSIVLGFVIDAEKKADAGVETSAPITLPQDVAPATGDNADSAEEKKDDAAETPATTDVTNETPDAAATAQ